MKGKARYQIITKTCLVMKLTVICLVVSLHVYAKGMAQESVTLNVVDAPLENVLKDIQKQTGYQYFMLEKWRTISHNVTVSIKNTPLQEALNLCFKDQPFTYSIIEKIIVVQEKLQAKAAETVAAQDNQPTEIRGRIISNKALPLAGATITLKGTDKIAITDAKGDFLIKGIPSGAYKIIITYVGYDRLEYEVKTGAADYTIALNEATNTLDEAQVIAYGSVSTREQVGNVTTVKAETIERQNVTNPLLALEGQVPGLLVTQSTGLPGSGVTVRVQGQNSIQNGNDPLYVIDGVPYNSQLLPSINYMLGGSGALGPGSVAVEGNPMSFLNPGDIESIEVLKDADATSIYGSRAANGAILITTKKGKVGQSRVDISFQDGFGKVPKFIDMMNTKQYLEMRHEAKANDNASIYSSDYDMNGFWDTTRNTNWQKTLLGGTAQYMNTSATISGGAPNIQYLVGGTYHRETTVFPGDFNDQKGSVHMNLNMNSPNRKFKALFSTNYQYDLNKLPGTDLTQYATVTPPDAPALYDNNGKINWATNAAGSATWNNPVAYVLQDYKNTTENLVSNLSLNYELFTGLSIRLNSGYTTLRSDQVWTIPLESIKPQYRTFMLPDATIGNNVSNSWILEPQLNYKVGLFGGKLDLLAGTTIQENSSKSYQFTASGYSNDEQLGDVSAAGSLIKGYSYSGFYKYNALFGRLNYVLKDKYIIDLSGRRDGSSRFGPENRFHNFMSVGGGWIFSNEGIIKNSLKVLNFGKLKGSYGITGNDQIGDYAYLSQYGANSNVQYQNITPVYPTGLANPYVQWETTKKLQAGIDLGFFTGSRILISVNYAKNRSSNQLLSYALPNFIGYASVLENFPATVENSDWELSLNSKNISSKIFEWSSSFNVTIQRNRLVSFPSIENSSYASSLLVGRPITIKKLFHSEGVDPQTGVYRFESKIDPYNPDLTTDANVIINTSPSLYGGLNNSFRVGQFSLDILIQFVKMKAVNYRFGTSAVPGLKSTNEPVYVLNRWQRSGDVKPVQRYNSDNTFYNAYLIAASSSDASYSDASYLKIKNASITWVMPDAVSRRLRVQGFKVFVQGQNLLTFSKYKIFDPETASPTALPPLRVITFGCQLSL